MIIFDSNPLFVVIERGKSMLKLLLWPFKLIYYCLKPFIWFYKNFFGYSTATSDSEGIDFEHTCANILRGRGFSNVEVTKASGDQGVDVLASKDGRRYAVQCKLYSNPVGNKAVQEVYAGKTYYGCTDAAVMTNSTFTESAKVLADSLGVELWENTPTSSKRKRKNSPIVFWGSIITLVAFWIYLFEAENAGTITQEISNDRGSTAALIWLGFILAYVFVFPFIRNIIIDILIGFTKIKIAILQRKLNKIRDNDYDDEIDSTEDDFELEPSYTEMLRQKYQVDLRDDDFDVDKFADECNAYLARQDEMKQWEES